MFSTKLLMLLLPLMIAGQHADPTTKQSAGHHKKRRQPMRSDVKVASGKYDEKDAKTSFGNNKQDINTFWKRSVEPMGGSGLARRHVTSKHHTHGPDPSKDNDLGLETTNRQKPMKSNTKAVSEESDNKDAKKPNAKAVSEESDDKDAKKPLGNNKHYISPYGGYGYGGYGYGGYGGYGYGGYGYGGYANPRGYGYYGGWDANPYTIY